jgi:hypothetical protein
MRKPQMNDLRGQELEKQRDLAARMAAVERREYSQGAGASTFLGLSDAPDAYTAFGAALVRVNAGATALEFAPLGSIDHNSLLNLATGDVHTQYAFLGGRSTGQVYYGGTAAAGSAVIDSTINAAKGTVHIAPSGGTVAIGALTTFAAGITFGDETISTYNQGTWTPTITTSGVAPTTLTYTAQDGKYLQIGNLIFFTFRVSINAFTLGSGSGDIRISLPTTVPSGNANTTRATCGVTGLDLTTPVNVIFSPTTGQAYGIIISTQDNATQVVEQVASLAGGDVIVATGFYFAS